MFTTEGRKCLRICSRKNLHQELQARRGAENFQTSRYFTHKKPNSARSAKNFFGSFFLIKMISGKFQGYEVKVAFKST